MPVCLPLFGRLFALCVVSSPPKKTIPCVPLRCFINTCLPYITFILNPIVPNPWRAPYTLPLGRTTLIINPIVPTRGVRLTPRPHSSYPQTTMSLSKSLAPVIFPTLHDRPRTNLVPWKVAINRAARAVFAEWDDFGFLFGVCNDAIWAVLNTPAGGVLRDRSEFPAPAALGANANPAARDVFKRATYSRAAWLACSASFCAAILESIGDANRLAIADPVTDTLHLSPRDIIIAITVFHGTMTGAEVDALRVPLKKKLTAISDLPGHIVAFRGTLGRLATVGQAPLALDVYQWFLAFFSPFPVFQQ